MSKQSELWQRLREARRMAGLTQTDVAKTLGITRAAVAFQESPNPRTRSMPNLEQVQQWSLITKVPMDYLANDEANVMDIYRYMDRERFSGVQPTPIPAPSPAPERRETPVQALSASIALPSSVGETAVRAKRSGTSAQLLQTVIHLAQLDAPEIADRFSVPMGPIDLAIRADYVHGDDLVSLAVAADVVKPESLQQVVARLLMQEVAMRRPMHKVLIVHNRFGAEIPSRIQTALEAFNIELRDVVSSDDILDELIG